MTLYQLRERLHNAAFAGANLVGEDFRLRNAIDQFSEMSSKNPVFAKIYQTIKPLADSSVTDKTAALLEAVTLVDAVCLTMAVTAKPENAEKIEAEKPTATEQYRYSNIADLTYALTSTGGGRYRIIYDAYKTEPKVFRDHRIIPLLYKGIDDSYSEIGVLCGKILVDIFGDEAAGSFKNEFMSIYDKYRNGGTGKPSREKTISAMLKRFRIIENREEKENDFYISLIKDEDMFSNVKHEAIRALRYDEKNIDFLIEISNCDENLSIDTNKGYEKYMIMVCAHGVLRDFKGLRAEIAANNLEHNIKIMAKIKKGR